MRLIIVCFCLLHRVYWSTRHHSGIPHVRLCHPVRPPSCLPLVLVHPQHVPHLVHLDDPPRRRALGPASFLPLLLPGAGHHVHPRQTDYCQPQQDQYYGPESGTSTIWWVWAFNILQNEVIQSACSELWRFARDEPATVHHFNFCMIKILVSHFLNLRFWASSYYNKIDKDLKHQMFEFLDFAIFFKMRNLRK